MSNVREYILELTVNQLSKARATPSLSSRPLPDLDNIYRNFEFDASRGTLSVDVDSAAKHGEWGDRPDYNPRKVDFSGRSLGSTRNYTLTFEWERWDDLIEDFEDRLSEDEEYTNIDDLLESMLSDGDVKVHCDCPSFHWMGVKHLLNTRNDATVDSTPHPRRPLTDPLSRIAFINNVPTPKCKHLQAFIGAVTEYGRPFGLFKKEVHREVSDLFGYKIPMEPGEMPMTRAKRSKYRR